MHMIDVEKIEKLVSMKDVIDAIEKFYLNGKDDGVMIPERMHIADGDNTALLMPSMFENYYGVKLVGVAPGNSERGEPTLNGTYVLHDRHTMKPLAIIDAQKLTALRTGAISGLGMKYMARDDASTIGIIGTGEQGWSHLQAACAVRPIQTALIYNRSPKRMEDFIKKANQHFPKVAFKVANPVDMLDKADIIITTTTSNHPVLPEITGVNLTGKHFAGAGAFKPDMQEIPDFVIEKTKYVYVDTHTAFAECGELLKAQQLGFTKNNTPDMKQMILNGENQAIKQDLTIFKSVGMAIYDSITAKLLYKKIKQYKLNSI